jgi:glycosyltransferase involved in cell wall biosynthesis
MRIAVLNQSEGGGATAQALDLAALAKEHGFETSYHPSGSDTDPAALEQRLAAFAPDVIHAPCVYNTWPPGTLALLSARWPVAFTLHDVYAVNQYGTECWECDHNAWCWACPALPIPKRLYSLYRVRSRRERERAWRDLRAHVIYPTEWMRRRVSGTALAKLPASLIPYGIDAGAFGPDPRAKERLGWPRNVPLVLTVGSQYSPDDDRKGFAILLDAHVRCVRREFAAARLVVIGRVFDPALREGATVIDRVDRAELAVWYAAADVFVLPSLGDNAPLAILEAMASGVPVVGTRVGGIPEEIEAGTGMLVPPREPALLGAAIISLLRDPALRSSLGAAGRERVLSRFSRAAAWSAHEALYRKLAAPGSAGPAGAT